MARYTIRRDDKLYKSPEKFEDLSHMVPTRPETKDFEQQLLDELNGSTEKGKKITTKTQQSIAKNCVTKFY